MLATFLFQDPCLKHIFTGLMKAHRTASWRHNLLSGSVLTRGFYIHPKKVGERKRGREREREKKEKAITHQIWLFTYVCHTSITCFSTVIVWSWKSLLLLLLFIWDTSHLCGHIVRCGGCPPGTSITWERPHTPCREALHTPAEHTHTSFVVKALRWKKHFLFTFNWKGNEHDQRNEAAVLQNKLWPSSDSGAVFQTHVLNERLPLDCNVDA